jgi:hypothetical protein
MTRYGWNAPGRILGAIVEEFDVEIVSEYEPRYWGFATQEEWDDAMAAVDELHNRTFYNEVAKFIRGEEHDIEPGTIGMEKAELAKRLVAETPELLSDDKRPELIKAVTTTYDRDRASRRRVTLPEEQAAFDMAATHEDDLNKG